MRFDPSPGIATISYHAVSRWRAIAGKFEIHSPGETQFKKYIEFTARRKQADSAPFGDPASQDTLVGARD